MSARKLGPLLIAAVSSVVRRLRYLLDGGRYPSLADLRDYLPGLTLLPELLQRPEIKTACDDLGKALADVTAEDFAKPHMRDLIEADLRHALNRLEPLLPTKRKPTRDRSRKS